MGVAYTQGGLEIPSNLRNITNIDTFDKISQKFEKLKFWAILSDFELKNENSQTQIYWLIFTFFTTMKYLKIRLQAK